MITICIVPHTANVTISAKRKSLSEAHNVIKGFFEYGGYDPDVVKIDHLYIRQHTKTKK